MAKTFQKDFPLIRKINELPLDEGNIPEIQRFTTPDYVINNLKHTLRPYQRGALYNLNWTQIKSDAETKYDHLMFNMATGSGKTDLMAAIILYMYSEFNYQEFLFVANSNAVVDKTYENFINENSAKYLFNAPIVINGKHIEITDVSHFPLNPDKDTIYIRLTTIQTLANELGEYRENGLTYEDLAKRKLVILADEAHHYNASTKKEKADESSWESVLDKVRSANPDNRQFEFTATIDVDKVDVYNKYKDKIVYKYELSSFMRDGFSKNVRRLESNQSDGEKMINAVLLSQFRKRIAKDNDIEDFKPVILFKSNKIKASKEARDSFLDIMQRLNADELKQFIEEHRIATNSETLLKTYDYWLKQDFIQTVVELKNDFSEMKTVNVNDEEPGRLLNTLEEPNNPIRVVFAVAKLTEGWDVLNLYDIVRLGEKLSKSITQTNQEAQLIGRGARYYPFVYQGKATYTRRFDNDTKSNLGLLETLFYHTLNDSTYLKNLHKSLNKLNLISEGDNPNDHKVETVRVKPEFSKTDFYKHGNLYHNRVERVPDEDYTSLRNYEINDSLFTVDMSSLTSEADLNDAEQVNVSNFKERIAVSFSSEADQRIINKAIARDSFYRYANLRKYIPTLKSIDQFLHNPSWLGEFSVKVKMATTKEKNDLTAEEKCKAVQQVLENCRKQIVTTFRKPRGTNVFEPVPVSDIIVNYDKKIPSITSTNMPRITPKDMSSEKWYVYDKAVLDQNEQDFIEMIRSFIGDTNLNDKYDEVYLLRIEETLGKFKLYEYDPEEESHYQAFMPDFILCAGNEKVSYQIFVEPKGIQLTEKDRWKEDFLEHLDPEKITIIGENSNVKLLGVKFYVKDAYGNADIHHTREELEEKLDVQNKGLFLN